MSIFDNIRKLDPDGVEYWNSRDLARALEYADYRNFIEVMEKAREACKNSHHREEDHFVDVTEMVKLGSDAERQVRSMLLSRYACYLSAKTRRNPKQAPNIHVAPLAIMQ
jgi:DNA-damage-inducible protein D